MAQNFNIVAKLSLQGPNNVRSIVNQLKQQLNSINASVQINVSQNINNKLNTLNTNLQRIDASLRSIRQSGLQANAALAQLASTIAGIRQNVNGINVQVKGLNNIAKAANNASNAMDSFGKQSGLAVRRFLAFAAPTTIFLGLVAAIKQGVAASIEFEREMTRVSQVTGRSVSSLTDLSGEISRLATGLGVGSKELSVIATTIAQAGLNAKDTKVALEALARSSLAATFTDIEQTTEGAIAVFRQFNVGASQLQGVIGSLNAASAQFAVESDDLISVIRRTGGAFKVAGGSLNELLGLFTSVRATTRESADSIATGFRTIFTRIQRPRTIQFLKELGVELQNTEGQFIGPVEAVRRLNIALKDVATTDPRFAAVIEELGGFRQVSKVIPLIQQFPEAIKAISVAEQGQLSIVEDSIVAQKSLANQIAKVREEFLLLFREIASDKSFQFFAKTSLELARSLIEITKSLKPLVPLLGSLALIQVGRNVGSVASNFSSALSGKKKFARGGSVPGSGNTDSVPALLTPGEFVINKSSAQAIGFNKLASMNKFASGGPVRQFAVAGLQPVGFKKHENVPVETNIAVNGKRQKIKENVDIFAAGLSANFAKKSEDIIRKRVGSAASDMAVQLQKSIGATPSQPTNLTAILKKSGFDTTVGNVFEAALALAGAPYTETTGKSIDFPRGIGPLGKAFAENFPQHVPTDAKRTADIKDFKRRNLLSFLRDEALHRAGVGSSESKPASSSKGINLSGVTSGTKFSAKELASALGTPGVGFKQLRLLPQVKTLFNESRAGGISSFIKKAGGGFVPGSGSGDTVPALLTPGEFVINKRSASKIGLGNLSSLNKFASGGAVSRSPQGGLNGTNLGLILASASALTVSLTDLDKKTEKLINSFTAIVGSASVLSFTIKGLANDKKLFTLSNATGAGGILVGNKSFGGQGRNVNRVAAALASNFDKLTFGITAASAAITVWGQSLQTSAAEQAKSAKTQKELNNAIKKDNTGSILAGTGVGAGIGAAIGTAIAPGIGTAIGAAIGAGGGAIVGSNLGNQKELIKIFRQSQFDKVAEKLDVIFDDFSNNRLTTDTAARKIGSEIRNQLSNVSGTSNIEQRGEFTKQLRGSLVNIRNLSQALAGQVTTLEEFRNSFGGTGNVLIQAISTLTNKSLPDVEKEIENEISVRRRATAAAASRAEASKVTEVLTTNIRSFADALQNVTESINKAQGGFEDLLSLMSGEGVGAKFSAVSSGLFGRASSGSISDPGVISSAIRAISGSLDSSSTKAIEETAVSVTRLTNILPNILERVSAGTGLGEDTERAVTLFEKEIDNLGDVSNSLKSIVKATFASELASRQQGGESGVIKTIREDVGGLISKLIPEALRESVKQLDDVNKSIQDIIEGIGKRLLQQAQAEFNISQAKVSLEEKILDIVKSRLKNNERLSFAQVKTNVSGRRAELLGGTRIAGVASVGGAQAALKNIISELKEANAAVDSTTGTEQTAAIKRVTDLGAEAQRLRSYLKDLAESTLELTHTQEELALAESDRKAGRGLVESLLFGEGKDRAAFSRFTGNAAEISSGRSSIGDLGPQRRKEFLEFLERLPQNKSLSLLGGQNVADFRNKQLRRSFIDRAKAEGADTGAASQLINELIGSTKEENDLTNRMIDIQNESIAASNALIAADYDLVAHISELNSTTLARLPDQIKRAIAEATIAGLRVQESSVSTDFEASRDSLSRFNSFQGEFFPNLDRKAAIKQTQLIKANESRFRDVGTAKQQIGHIRGLNVDAGNITKELVSGGIKTAGTISDDLANKVLSKNLSHLQNPDERNVIEGRLRNRFNELSFSDLPSGRAQGVTNPLTGRKVFDTNKIQETLTGIIETTIQAAKTELINNQASKGGSAIRQLRDTFSADDISKFGNLETLDRFSNGLKTFDDALLSGIDPLGRYIDNIQNLNAELVNIQSKIESLSPAPAAGKASGGIIGGRGIRRPLVSFSPRGTDTVPAMLTAGEFVVNKNSAQANLPLLQAINAAGFARGGRIPGSVAARRRALREDREAIRAQFKKGRQDLRSSFQNSPEVLARQAERNVARVVGRANAAALKANPLSSKGGLSGSAARDELRAAQGTSITAAKLNRGIAESTRAADLRRIQLKMQADESARAIRAKFKGVPSSSISEEDSDIEAARAEFERRKRGFASGGFVPGAGHSDNVPALLTPGEFVLNRRATRALGLNTLAHFNNRFANGGVVGGGSGGGTIDINQAALEALENFNTNFKAATADFSSNISRFAETGSSLSNALSRWSSSAAQLSETMASFPTEVQVNHSPITVAVNISGLEGLESAVIDKVMGAVNERLSSQKAKAADGKSPFFAR